MPLPALGTMVEKERNAVLMPSEARGASPGERFANVLHEIGRATVVSCRHGKDLPQRDVVFHDLLQGSGHRSQPLELRGDHVETVGQRARREYRFPRSVERAQIHVGEAARHLRMPDDFLERLLADFRISRRIGDEDPRAQVENTLLQVWRQPVEAADAVPDVYSVAATLFPALQ